jgi:hypothetical protein
MNKYYGLMGLNEKISETFNCVNTQHGITQSVVSGRSKGLRKWWDFSRHQIFRPPPYSEIDGVIYQYSISLFFYNIVPTPSLSLMGIVPRQVYFYPDESYVTPALYF